MVTDLLVFLKQNKVPLVAKWAKKTNLLKPGYIKLSFDDIHVGASAAYDAFCDIIENNDYKNIDRFIEWVTQTRRSQNISFNEIQRGFSDFRYILFPIIFKIYSGAELYKVLEFINRIIDLVVFRFSDFFKSIHEQALENYAQDLDKEVKTRTNELEESRKNYQILVEGISDGCFVCQEDRIVFANISFCEMHRYGFDELIGQKYLKLVAPDSKTIVDGHFKTQLYEKTNTMQYVYLRQDKHGHYFPTENRVTSIKYNNKDAFLGLCTDITKRLEAEENVRQKERLALIGKLTTSIAHEIRNPLSAIKVNVQLLLNCLKLENYDLRRMQIVNEQLIKLESVLSQILGFAKPVRLEYALTNIREIVDRSAELLEPGINEKNCRLSIKLASNLPNVFIDKEKIMQALTNILKNAVEALNGSSRFNKIEVKAKKIIHNSKEYIKISVIDNGIGIGIEDQKYVFEPFYTKGKKDGVGLGLPNVKKILDAHCGSVSVKSLGRKGTSFDMLIPTNLSMSNKLNKHVDIRKHQRA